MASFLLLFFRETFCPTPEKHPSGPLPLRRLVIGAKQARALPSTTKSCRATKDGWSEPMLSHEGRMKRVKPVIKWWPYSTWQLVSIYCVCCFLSLLLPALSPAACCLLPATCYLLLSLPLPLFKFPTIPRAFCFSNSNSQYNSFFELFFPFIGFYRLHFISLVQVLELLFHCPLYSYSYYY